MFLKLVNFSSKPEIDFLLKLFISVAMLCLISPYTWEISSEYDVMFGSLMVCLVPAFFGWRIGALAVFLYLLAGALGLPVFAGHSGGLHYFIPKEQLHSSTGFLFGYLMAAFAVGYMAEKIKPGESLKVLALFIVGHIFILSLGYLHMYRIPNFEWSLIDSLQSVLPSFLVKLGIFAVIISMIGRKLDSSFDEPVKD